MLMALNATASNIDAESIVRECSAGFTWPFLRIEKLVKSSTLETL